MKIIGNYFTLSFKLKLKELFLSVNVSMYTHKFSKKLPVRNQNLHVYCITNKKKKNALACNLAIFKLRNFKFPANFINISEASKKFRSSVESIAKLIT